MTTPLDYTISFPLRTYDLAPSARLAPAAVARFFQEAASAHATSLGFGAEALSAAGTFWVAFRLAFEFGELPKWSPGAAVTMVTWSRGVKKLQAYRDFELRDAAGVRVAAGTSSWLALDLETRRPHRLDVTPTNFPHVPGRHAIAPAAIEQPLPVLPAAGAALMSHVVRYSDLDLNGHVNNTRYIDWAFDALGPAHWQSRRATQIVINYLAETHVGDTVEVFACDGAGEMVIRAAGKDACRIRIESAAV